MGMLRKKIDGFYLVEKLGDGGMSEVFLGINPRIREKRAFKILGKSATKSASGYARFLREVDIMRGLSHPGIIRVLDSGTMEDLYYYSMEYMPGGNLSRHMQGRKIPVDEALNLFMPVCRAMAYAHDQSVIHRDLKPSNILLNTNGDPVVSDFGIAKVLNYAQTPLTHSGDILGTVAYLAPEQRFNSKEVRRRADVYALGAIFYEMFMGFPPLGKFPWPWEVTASFPESLHPILENCLAIEPESRFEHAGHLRDELEKCIGSPTGEKRIAPEKRRSREFSALEESELPAAKTDRIETWFRILRNGTTRERLAAIREMVKEITPAEAKTLLKLYPEEGDRVRWGLIRVLGELKIEGASSLILGDLDSPFHTECVIEALGKIGSEKAFDTIYDYVLNHPDCAMIAMLPLARTGGARSIPYLKRYLDHEMAVLRQAAVRALGAVAAKESLQLLKERLPVEQDDKVRAFLLQSIHSLQAHLLPDVTTSIRTKDDIAAKA
jgi:hypothetical protein